MNKEYKTHRVYIDYGSMASDRAYWECDCGISGSCDKGMVAVNSDRHIPEGDMRVDVSKAME